MYVETRISNEPGLVINAFPKRLKSPFGFLCNTNFRVIKGFFFFFYSLTVIGLWNQKELLLISGFIGQHVYCVGISSNDLALYFLRELTFIQHFILSSSWVILKKYVDFLTCKMFVLN